MHISLIVAVTENGVIGKDNKLLWALPSDMQRFVKLTMGKPIIMGRKTFQSIGKPLKGRDNIVITADQSFQAKDAFVVNSVEQALTKAKECAQKREVEEIMVIGGEQIYQQTLELASSVCLSLVHTHLKGDAFFPALDETIWQEVSRELFSADEKHNYDYSYIVYTRA